MAVGGGVVVGVGVTDGVMVGVAVGVGDGDTVGVAVGVGVGLGPAAQKISVEASGVMPSMSYPPERTILLVPSVSVGKLRRALLNGKSVDQVLVPGS